MNRVDEFIIYDSVQMTNNDWRNRNMIKTYDGLKWLTIPVRHHFGQSIDKTEVIPSSWARKHWLTMKQNYRKANCWADYAASLEALYEEVSREPLLSRVNSRFLTWVRRALGIRNVMTNSSAYELVGDRVERLVNICRQAGATEYISGPAAKDYLNESMFSEAGIKVTYMDYSGYPEYPQLHGPLEHHVSVLDLILNTGPDAPKYMKATR